MLMFVKLEVKNSLVGPLVPETRMRAGKAISPIMQSGKAVSSGLFADQRGGFILLDVDSVDELAEMLAPMLDGFDLETHPVVPLESLPVILKKLEDQGL